MGEDESLLLRDQGPVYQGHPKHKGIPRKFRNRMTVRFMGYGVSALLFCNKRIIIIIMMQLFNRAIPEVAIVRLPL